MSRVYRVLVGAWIVGLAVLLGIGCYIGYYFNSHAR